VIDSTNWRISAHREGKVAELAHAGVLCPIGTNSSADPGTPIEIFEARRRQLENQELRPINHNLVHYRDFIFAMS
jgi:hypothetical protein